MLPEKFVEQQIRIYFRKNDPESLEKAKRLVNALLLHANLSSTSDISSKLLSRDNSNNDCLPTRNALFGRSLQVMLRDNSNNDSCVGSRR